MRKISQILLFLLLLVGCTPSEVRREQKAAADTERLWTALRENNMQAMWEVIHDAQETIFLVFQNDQLVFWSDNSLIVNTIPLSSQPNQWEDFRFDNADTRVMWTGAGSVRVITVLPMVWHLDHTQVLEQSFSYRSLLNTNEDNAWSSHMRVRMYYIILVALGLLVLTWCGVLVVRAGGFGNLNLRRKIQLVLGIFIVICFTSVIVSVVHFERLRYEQQQQQRLQEQCTHVCSALQSLYYWDLYLSDFNTQGLNADLRDLAHTYNTDIHVFDMNGLLIGSSTPQLFQQGLLSPYIAPEIIFSDSCSRVINEHIGKDYYLTVYNEFYNGSQVQIGYISMPCFISREEMAHEEDQLLARLLPPFLIGLLLMLLVSYVAARGLTRPLQILTDKMQHFVVGKKDNHITYQYQDEIGELVQHYNEMADQLEEYTRRLTYSEREGAWKTVARQIAHEINNPLTPMKLMIQQLQRIKGTPNFDQQFDKAASMLVEQIDNLSRIATSFSTLAKMPEVHPAEVDIAERLCTAIDLHAHNSQQIPIRYVGPDTGMRAYADPEQITQVFTNILRNALQALEGQQDGNIIVRLQEEENEVCISFSDNGPGIPEDVQEKIFTPNFTTKSTGAGLGLAISKNIVEGGNGRISFESSKKGTIFLVHLKKM